MTPFEKFFAGEFQRRLDGVEVPGAPDASWDRKAAYLLWCEINPDQRARDAIEGRRKPSDMDDLL